MTQVQNEVANLMSEAQLTIVDAYGICESLKPRLSIKGNKISQKVEKLCEGLTPEEKFTILADTQFRILLDKEERNKRIAQQKAEKDSIGRSYQ